MKNPDRIRQDGIDRITIPVSRLIASQPELKALHDPSIGPDPSRIRRLLDEHPVGDDAVPMATITTSTTGGSLRTMFKPASSERGVWPCALTRRLLHWEGAAARAMLVRATTDFHVVRIGTETVHVSHPDYGGYTVDLDIVRRDGSRWLLEIKRDERDLAKAKYRAKIAWASEVFRRSGFGFGVVFRDDIFSNVRHRRNAELFSSRGFVHVGRRAKDRLEEHAARRGSASTYGELAEVLGGGDALVGCNLLQALVVRRRVEIDLDQRLVPATPVTIH